MGGREDGRRSRMTMRTYRVDRAGLTTEETEPVTVETDRPDPIGSCFPPCSCPTCRGSGG